MNQIDNLVPNFDMDQEDIVRVRMQLEKNEAEVVSSLPAS
jgi:hypothetical protein